VAKTIKGSELGVKDCDFNARGETAGDVVRELVDHLRDEHAIDMPDADVILAGELSGDPREKVDPAVALIIKRLTNALNIVPSEGTQTPRPSASRSPSKRT
jgi:predicted small metal-binding protein